MSTQIHKTVSLIEPLSNDKGKEINRNKSLTQFGRKKSVSFSTRTIVDVEKWKKYNVDVSAVGGCSSWDIKKNEEKYEEKRNKNKEDGCVCIIF